MTEPTAWDRAWFRVQDELRASPGVRVLQELREPAAETTVDEVVLDAALYERSVGFGAIAGQWTTVEPYAPVTGEFYLEPLAQAVSADPPDFTSMLDSDDEAEEEERVAADLRVIDSAPFTGSGSYTAIRLQPGVTDPEVWFDDHTLGLWRMDLDFPAYAEFLLLTKGAFGWQHLFTRAPLGEWEFQSAARRIANMLDALPRLFPDHDYTPLLARSRERLDAAR
ncbi:hypothetical protein AB0I28_06215 [Phytomonospora sp. NPDC050363]|uniref:hypothetical protein n=1 Tax=Phytomonospora sp. NPDC050363 TaxID=3155642 RepID=UPI0033FDA18D